MVNSKPILLLHGALGSSENFKKIISDSSNKPFYSFDFSGHGAKPKEGKLSFHQFVNDIKLFIEKNDLNECDVFGYSMGGYAALYTALKFPKLIGKIYTLGTKMNWTPEIASHEVKMLNPDKMAEKIPKYAEYLQKLHGTNWANLVRQTAWLMEDLGNGMALGKEELSQIKNKVVIGLGGLDKMVTSAESLWAVEQLPNARFVLLPEVEHPIEKVNLTEVLNAITRLD